MKTHEEMVAEWINDPQFKGVYDALEEEFALFAELVRTHAKRSGSTFGDKNTRSCQTRICGGQV